MYEMLSKFTDNLLLSPIALSFVAILAVIWLTVSRRSGKKLPPGLPALPVAGSIPFLGLTGKDDHLRCMELAKKYGSIYSFWIANKFVVVLNGYDSIKAALTDQSTAFAGRAFTKSSPLMRYTNPNQLGLISAHYDARRKKEREVSLSILRDFGFGQHLIEYRIREEVDSLVMHLGKLNGNPCDLRQPLTIYVSNVIGAIVLGKRFPIDDCDRLKRVIAGIEDNFKIIPKCLPMNFFPVVEYIPWFRKLVEQYRNNHTEFHDFIQEFIDQHEASHHTGKEEDFIDAFINRMGDGYNADHLWFIVRDLFSAGTETTAVTLLWVLVYMANNRDIQQRVQDEIDTIVGRGRPVYLEDKARLPYTEAVLLEVQRLACVVPGALPHGTTQDTELHGYHIPANTMVLVNLWSVLRDPELWPEPETFRPERFLDSDGKTIIQRPELIPFSLGRRSCLGEVMAKQELFLFFCGLMQNFNIKAPPGIGKLDENGKAAISRVPLPFEIVAESRK